MRVTDNSLTIKNAAAALNHLLAGPVTYPTLQSLRRSQLLALVRPRSAAWWMTPSLAVPETRCCDTRAGCTWPRKNPRKLSLPNSEIISIDIHWKCFASRHIDCVIFFTTPEIYLKHTIVAVCPFVWLHWKRSDSSRRCCDLYQFHTKA